MEAPPSTIDCCSRLAQIRSNTATSTHRPPHRSHSRMGSLPMVTEAMSLLQRGHFSTESSAAVVSAAAAPQCGQCRLPINIIPKQEGQAMVARFDSQYWHRGESEEIAAPQLGQRSEERRVGKEGGCRW